MTQQAGTITWFRCDDKKPPVKKSESGIIVSDYVLIQSEGKRITEGCYYEGLDGWRHGSGNWQPTHWAYINLPNE